MKQISDLTPYLDPDIAAALEQQPAVDWREIDDFGAARAARPGSPMTSTEDVTIHDITLPGYESGDYQVPVRVYVPVAGPAEETFVWIHGGGFVFGTAFENDLMCVVSAKRNNINVVSVDWRLAPEHPFPAGLNDCYAALLWVGSGPELLGGTQKKIAVGGGSAGGCLAAATSLLARDLKGPEICYQVLVIPVLDDRMETRTAQIVNDPRVWNRDKSLQAWQMYLGEGHAGEVSPYASPARATDLSGLPPASVFAEEMDLLRDEAVEYANRLAAANVRTNLTVWAGTTHGHMGLAPQAEVSRRANRDVQEAIKMAFDRPLFG